MPFGKGDPFGVLHEILVRVDAQDCRVHVLAFMPDMPQAMILGCRFPQPERWGLGEGQIVQELVVHQKSINLVAELRGGGFRKEHRHATWGVLDIDERDDICKRAKGF